MTATETLYENHQGVNCAVLLRADPRARTEPCPFCGERHRHAMEDGHRVAHCEEHGIEITAQDGTVLNSDDGYIVRTRQLR